MDNMTAILKQMQKIKQMKKDILKFTITLTWPQLPVFDEETTVHINERRAAIAQCAPRGFSPAGTSGFPRRARRHDPDADHDDQEHQPHRPQSRSLMSSQ
jgi:hypothetical protein